MRSLSAYRDAAWNSLSGKWMSAVVLTLAYFSLTFVITSLEMVVEYFSSIISILLTAPIAYSYSVAFLEYGRSEKRLDVKSLFNGFNDYFRITGTYLLECLYIFLWSLLLLIPGVIKAISYSQVFYILHDEPTLSYNKAIERSMAMMDGHKMEYFLLGLSFIGWFLLGMITLGIGFLWINPYIIRTLAIYYEDLKCEYERKITA